MNTSSSRRLASFTITELLLLIAIACMLAVMLAWITPRAAEIEHQKTCMAQMAGLYKACIQYESDHGNDYWPPLWITQLADLGYLGDLRSEGGEVPSRRSRAQNEKDMKLTRSVLICPADGTMGKDGGRPGDLVLGDGKKIPQYPYADVDSHLREEGTKSPSLPPGRGDPTETGQYREDSVPCSYVYEFNCEPCDWVYSKDDGTDGASVIRVSALRSGEFEGATWTDEATVKRLCDINQDGWVSWFEIKQRTIRGSADVNLRSWGMRVPFLRCYWHVTRPTFRDDSQVNTVSVRGDVITGRPQWYGKD